MAEEEEEKKLKVTQWNFRTVAFEVLTSEQKCEIGSGLSSQALGDDVAYS